jgi:hypothetical protein
LGIPTTDSLNYGEFINFGYGTFLRFAPNRTDTMTSAIYLSASTKNFTGYRISRGFQTYSFIATQMRSIEGRISYPSKIEILDEKNNSIGVIDLESALLNVPVPENLSQSPGRLESSFWLHEWIR